MLLALVLTIVVGIAEWELIRKLLQLIFGEKMENTKSEVKNVKVGKTGLDLVEKAKQTKRSEKAENISFKDNEDVKNNQRKNNNKYFILFDSPFSCFKTCCTFLLEW